MDRQKIEDVKRYILRHTEKVGPYMGIIIGWTNSKARVTRLLLEEGDLTKEELVHQIDRNLRHLGLYSFQELLSGWTPYTVSSKHALAYAIWSKALNKHQISYVESKLDKTETTEDYITRYHPNKIVLEILDYLVTEREVKLPTYVEKFDLYHDPHPCCECGC